MRAPSVVNFLQNKGGPFTDVLKQIDWFTVIRRAILAHMLAKHVSMDDHNQDGRSAASRGFSSSSSRRACGEWTFRGHVRVSIFADVARPAY